jgi:hypothetical protein
VRYYAAGRLKAVIKGRRLNGGEGVSPAMSNNPAKWVELAAQIQAEVIAEDAADPGAPISGHQVKRAMLHTRHDMVMVVSLLGTLTHQADKLEKSIRAIVRIGWLVTALLIIIAARIA